MTRNKSIPLHEEAMEKAALRIIVLCTGTAYAGLLTFGLYIGNNTVVTLFGTAAVVTTITIFSVMKFL